MRPINSSYDRMCATSEAEGRAVLALLAEQGYLDYADTEHLDDVAWALVRDHVEDDGSGYWPRRRGDPRRDDP